MYPATTVTWIIIAFGSITCLPLLFAQLVIIFDPHGTRAKDILIGKGEEWRDRSHFKSAYSLAWADWIIFAPLFIVGIIGMIKGLFWGYILLSISGAIQLYINVFLRIYEKEYVYAAQGALRYYTFIWGNFIYWGIAALIYGILRLNGIDL